MTIFETLGLAEDASIEDIAVAAAEHIEVRHAAETVFFLHQLLTAVYERGQADACEEMHLNTGW